MSNGYGFITLDGQKVLLRFGMMCLEVFQEGIKKYSGGVGVVAYALYGGYCNWCYVKQVPTEIEFEKFCDYAEDSLIDPAVREEREAALTVFNESKFIVAAAGVAKEDQKKSPKRILKK